MDIEITIPRDLKKLKKLAKDDVPEGKHTCKISAKLLYELVKDKKYGA